VLDLMVGGLNLLQALVGIDDMGIDDLSEEWVL
jgi:hypothetical protein